MSGQVILGGIRKRAECEPQKKPVSTTAHSPWLQFLSRCLSATDYDWEVNLFLPKLPLVMVFTAALESRLEQ